MPRPEKVQAVADIKERITNAQAVFLAEYAGLSVSQQQTLRRELKANGAEFKVVKMTLTRLAAAELEIDTLDEHLLGPTGLTIADGDAVAAAKVLKDFAKAHDVFKVKGGLLGLEYLSPERVSELADIEPREVLLARLAGLFAAPMGNVASLLQAVQRDVVGVVQALVEKREASGEVAEVAEAVEAVAVEAVDEAADGDTEAPAEQAPAETADADETDVAEAEAVVEDVPEASAEAEAADVEPEPDVEAEAVVADVPEASAEAEAADVEPEPDVEAEAVVEDVPEASAEAEAADAEPEDVAVEAAEAAADGDTESQATDADDAAEDTTDEDPADEAEEE